MKNWKIIKQVFNGVVTKELANNFDFNVECGEDTPNKGDNLYYCYRRKFIFWWQLKNIKTEYEYNMMMNLINKDNLSNIILKDIIFEKS